MSRPAHILITGAGGFVGSWLLRRLSSLLPSKDSITAVGSQEARGEGSPILDVTDEKAVDAIIARLRPTTVIHLAAISSPPAAQRDARLAWEVNLYGTMHVAQAMIEHAPDARLIFASSSEIYGGSLNSNGEALDEDALLKPRSVYAATKAAADLMLGQMCENGLQSVRFRPFNHAGPGQATDFVIPAFAAQIVAIERGECPPVLKVGNLEARRDFLDVRDVVEAYVAAIFAPSLPRNPIFNLASGVPRKIGDILDALLSMSRVPIQIEQDQSLMRPIDTPLTIGNARRATEVLGWRPAITWESTLRDILESHRQTPSRKR